MISDFYYENLKNREMYHQLYNTKWNRLKYRQTRDQHC